MVNTPKPSQLPSFFQPLFWSYNFAALDPEAQKKTIIVNTVNYGGLAHWRWISQHYGKEVIRELLETIPATELRPRAQRLANIIFSSTHHHDASRGAH